MSATAEEESNAVVPPTKSSEQYDPSSSSDGPPPRQWLNDRINGKSKIDGQEDASRRPPCCMCWVPPPVGFCPSITEENCFCKCYGKIGCIDPSNEKARYWILHVGFWANVIGFILTLVAAFAISQNYDIIRNTSWSRTILSGEQLLIKTPNNAWVPPDYFVQIDVGLTAVAWDFHFINQTTTTTWIDFCDIPSDNLQATLESKTGNKNQCTACGEVSKSMVVSVIISVVTFIPSFATDILRMYSNYDVNCQKVFSTLFATITIIASINALVKYNNACFASFYEGNIGLTLNLTVPTNPNDAAIDINFDWKMGPGLACLYAGTILKLVDVIANLIVPTPTITRSDEEKWQYEQQFALQQDADGDVADVVGDGGGGGKEEENDNTSDVENINGDVLENNNKKSEEEES